MNERNLPPQFEENISQSFGIPAIRPEFVDQVYADLMRRAGEKPRKSRPFFSLRPAWTVALAFLTLMIVGTLVIGPQRVYAEFAKLFGYLPGVGIVDQSTSIRVLAEPVTVTRDEISITVTSATLTGDKTYLDYRIFGVPGSAYPDQEDLMGCTTAEYLRLPDGTRIERIDNDFAPVPAGIDTANFVIPCIFNTLPGTTPENWEISLHFVPAPPDLTMMPVVELSPSPQIRLTPDGSISGPSVAPEANPVTVNKVIETSDGYILIGQFQPQTLPGESFQPTDMMQITDATGKIISYSYPEGVSEGINQVENGNSGSGWAAQFKAAGLTYPLTISFSGVLLSPVDPNASTEFTFDAGSDPQPGQEWVLNQDIQLAGHTLKLVSITATSGGGYSFHFETGPEVFSASVQILGYAPNGGGGGGPGGLTNGTFNVSLSYGQLPTGVLTVVLSNLTLIGDPVTWQGQWSPTTPRTDLPANPDSQPDVCLTRDSLSNLQPAPETLLNGKALIYEKLDTGTWGLAVYNLDGSLKQVVVPNGNWGSLSPDGSRVAYSSTDNSIRIVDVVAQTEVILPGAGGFNLHWSPDGNQIAYVGIGEGSINSVFVINTDGAQINHISDLSYETIIGWSPDGNQIYFAAPYTGGAAWKVYSYDFSGGVTTERFTIENGTAKFLNPKLSPDGNWIAYRGRDNSSIYLVHPDGSDMHLVVDNANVVGIEWSRSGWLGMSLRKDNSDESTAVLIKPDGCQAYSLPADLNGDLQGLFIP